MLFGSGQLRYRIGLACSGRDDISARSERVSAFQNLSVNRWLWGAVTNVRTAAGGAGPRRSAKRGFRHQAGDARSVGRVPRHGQFGAMGRGSEEMRLARADLQLTTPLQKTHARAAIAAIAIWLRRICISRRASNGLARRSSRIILIPQRFGAGTRIGGTVGGIFGWLGVSGEKSSHRIKLLTSARGSLLRYQPLFLSKAVDRPRLSLSAFPVSASHRRCGLCRWFPATPCDIDAAWRALKAVLGVCQIFAIDTLRNRAISGMRRTLARSLRFGLLCNRYRQGC